MFNHECFFFLFFLCYKNKYKYKALPYPVSTPTLQFLQFDHKFETVYGNDCFYEDINTSHTQNCRPLFSTNLDVVICGKDTSPTL